MKNAKTNSSEEKSDLYQAFTRHPSYGQVPLNNVCVMSMRVPAAPTAAAAA